MRDRASVPKPFREVKFTMSDTPQVPIEFPDRGVLGIPFVDAQPRLLKTPKESCTRFLCGWEGNRTEDIVLRYAVWERATVVFS